MSKFIKLAGGVALAVACTAAGARMHQICYEAEPQSIGGTSVPTAIVGCSVDGGGSCTITPGSGMSPRSAIPLRNGVASPGTFDYFNLVNAGAHTATITFFDSNSVNIGTRQCTLNAVGPTYSANAGYATPGAVLTGFTTDASGLATSGVWRLVSPVNAAFRQVSVRGPGDFVAVGGGAVGTNAPNGALITYSARDWNVYPNDLRSWRAQTSEASGAQQPHRTTAYVIGLHIEGLTAQQLNQLLVGTGIGPATAQTTSPQAGHPGSEVRPPAGTVVIGGGFAAMANGSTGPALLGQFATMNAPLMDGYYQCRFVLGTFSCTFVPTGVGGWRAESKDHVLPAPGTITTQVMALPAQINVRGTTFNVTTRLVTATSAVTAHPAVDVGGLRGAFALTGIGATVDWRRFDQNGNQTMAGNLLWKLEPRADLGGASVASKDHAISSPAAITGHAIGIQLQQMPGT